jgi:hypothetical protein
MGGGGGGRGSNYKTEKSGVFFSLVSSQIDGWDLTRTEMEFLNGLLVEVSGPTLVFPFYQMLFMKRFRFSFFADSFVWIFKTRVEHGFL